MSDPSGTFDALEPRRKKVAIVGFALSTRDQAPFADPTWEIWGMNQLYRMLPRLTRWFEMHPHTGSRSYLADQVKDTDYVGWMKSATIPIYMLSRRDDVPSSVTYPIDQMLVEFGQDYFHSSVDYMLALAISEGFEELGVWGVDMAHDTEYGFQKPSAEFWLGVAKGRGMKVTLPTGSALLKKAYRYGLDPEPSNLWLVQLEGRRRALTERRGQLATELAAVDGALQENAHWTEFSKATWRGVTLPTSS